MTKPVQLVLVIHNHQPVGNFDHVFEEACRRAYLPFLRLLREYPTVRIGLHTSGCLWEWVEANCPEYGELVDGLLAAGQVELLGGGMYEPILPVLPTRDALWQLDRMNDYVEKRFGVRPRGAWIPERVWEPQLPEVLAAAGIRYCLLDDYHFEGNAPAERIATDYFMTNHAGSEVALLPIAKELRYTIPFKPASETIEYLRGLAENAPHTPLAVFGDDGEKFGIWPDTYEWVYEQGWLRDFLGALSDNQEWLQLKLPGEVLTERAPADSVYIPSRSYMEMGKWTRIGAGDQPGHWRNFFQKYPESRQAYERVMEVSDELRHAGDNVSAAAWDDLGRAQCNCSYWHGVFGGIYLNYLRQAVTQHLLKAELAAGLLIPRLGKVNSDALSLTTSPQHGLSISRIDYYPTLFNWGDVLARRREAYHDKLVEAQHTDQETSGSASIHELVRVKEPGLDRRLVVDPHPRHSFVTYFSKATEAEQFMYVGPGDEAVLSHADWFVPAQVLESGADSVVALVQQGRFGLRKRLALHEAALSMELCAAEAPAEAGMFFVEFNLTVLTDQAEDRYMLVDGERRKLSDGIRAESIRSVALVDEWQQRRIVLETQTAAKLISYPIYTVSSSEAGFERTYQGTCLMLGFDPGELNTGLAITLRIEEL